MAENENVKTELNATETPVEAPVKKTKVKEEAPKENTEISDLKKQNQILQEQINALMQMMAKMGGTSENKPTNSLMDEVKIVHLVDRGEGLATHIQLTNMAIDLHAFGEERTLDRRQAEELAGRYRKWFDRGVIAFGSGNEDIAKKFALKSVNEYEYANSDFIGKLGRLSVYELEDLYKKLGSGHKSFVIEYFKRKIIEKDPAFNDPHKIEMLNRVSDGAMSDVLLDRQRDAMNASNK